MTVIKPKYKCPICGSEYFFGNQYALVRVLVGNDGGFQKNLERGMEKNVYDSNTPFGPFLCSGCATPYKELPEYKHIRLPHGTYLLIKAEAVDKAKKRGYGYYEQGNGYTIVSNGARMLAMKDAEYERVYGETKEETHE